MVYSTIVRRLAVLAAVATTLVGCDLDLENPNAVTEEVVLSDANGVIALAVGMQGQFAQSVGILTRAAFTRVARSLYALGNASPHDDHLPPHLESRQMALGQPAK